MTHPIPSGTRDVLPDEMRELRAITTAIHGALDARGYGEVYTPALEFESTLRAGDARAAEPAYKLFDEQGAVLALRSDMTVPIARLVGSRYQDAEPPLRFSYFAHAYRGVKPQRGQAREFLQAGVELVGAGAPDGTAEALTVLCAALDAVGLRTYRIGLGDASVLPALLDHYAVGEAPRGRILHELATRDLVGLRRELGVAGLDPEAAALIERVTSARGGRELLGDLPAPAAGIVAGLADVLDLLAPDVASRVILDLGLLRTLGYYTGAVFEVYDPALGVPLGGGGRYDDLLGAFGRPLPAVGWALNVERVHIALAEEGA